jgi:hypothetical protein
VLQQLQAGRHADERLGHAAVWPRRAPADEHERRTHPLGGTPGVLADESERARPAGIDLLFIRQGQQRFDRCVDARLQLRQPRVRPQTGGSVEPGEPRVHAAEVDLRCTTVKKSFGMPRAALAALLGPLLLAATLPAHGACDTRLERTDGTPAPLVAAPDKPAAIFYEDRGSTGTNQALKDAIYQRGRAEGLLEAASIVAVANIQAYDFFPAKDFALAFIRAAEQRAGVPILIDAAGTMSRAPWNLPATGSTVVLLDRDCREVSRHTGALDAAARDALLERLRGLVAARPGS